MRESNPYAPFTSALLGMILISLGIYFLIEAGDFPFPSAVLYITAIAFILYGLFRFVPNLLLIIQQLTNKKDRES